MTTAPPGNGALNKDDEMEERAAKLVAVEQPECQYGNFAECDADSCYCRKGARSVLALYAQAHNRS